MTSADTDFTGPIVWCLFVSLFTLGSARAEAKDVIAKNFQSSYDFVVDKRSGLLLVEGELNGKAVRLLVDSGAEVPSLSLSFVERAGIDYTATARPEVGVAGGVRSGTLALQGPDLDPSTTTAYPGGPWFVVNSPALPDWGFDGLIPPNMLWPGRCKIFDISDRSMMIGSSADCPKKLFLRSETLKLQERRSNPARPLFKLILLGYFKEATVGKTVRLLLDTGASSSILADVAGLPQTSEWRLFVKLDGEVRVGRQLAPVCFVSDGTGILIEKALSSDKTDTYPFDGIIGLNALAGTKILYEPIGRTSLIIDRNREDCNHDSSIRSR